MPNTWRRQNRKNRTSLEKGMKWEDVAAIYGMPKSMTEEEIAGTKVSKCVFEKDDQIVEVTLWKVWSRNSALHQNKYHQICNKKSRTTEWLSGIFL
ncbi:MAG: hypothetical protein R3C26_10775 [Calditrichia bacterium]